MYVYASRVHARTLRIRIHEVQPKWQVEWCRLSRREVRASLLKHNFRFFDCRPMMEIVSNGILTKFFFESYRFRIAKLGWLRSLVARLSIQSKKKKIEKENKGGVLQRTNGFERENCTRLEITRRRIYLWKKVQEIVP